MTTKRVETQWYCRILDYHDEDWQLLTLSVWWWEEKNEPLLPGSDVIIHAEQAATRFVKQLYEELEYPEEVEVQVRRKGDVEHRTFSVRIEMEPTFVATEVDGDDSDV